MVHVNVRRVMRVHVHVSAWCMSMLVLGACLCQKGDKSACPCWRLVHVHVRRVGRVRV